MKILEIIKNFFNFDLSKWGLEFRIWKYPSEIGEDVNHKVVAYLGKIPNDFNSLYCGQVSFDANEQVATFYCSENDEDF